MKIDIGTLSIVLGISFILQSLALLFLYLQSNRYKGLLQWFIGSAMISIGTVLMLLRQMPSVGNLSIILSNFFQIGGMLIVFAGTAYFTRSKVDQKLIAIFLILYILFDIYFTWISNQINIRVIGYSLCMSCITFLIGLKLIHHQKVTIHRFPLLVAMVFFAMSALFLFRICYILFIEPMTDFWKNSQIQSAIFLGSFILCILWTFGLIIMVNQKLFYEKIEARKHFEEIFNSNPDLALVVKIPEQIIVDMNESFTLNTGYTRDEIIGKSGITDFDPFANINEKATMMRTLRETGSCSNMEISFHRKDQSVFLGLFSARKIDIHDSTHAICIIRNITEQKKGEEKIRESEKKYRQLFENAPIGIFTTSINGKAMDVNPYLAHLLGLNNSAEALEYYQDLGAQLYVDLKRRDEFIRLIKLNGNVENFEYEAITYDQRKTWLNMNARLTRGENGEEQIEGFTTDITQRKKNETELIAAKEKAEESDRLKTSFLANMSHEIRTPMNSIMGFASLIPEEDRPELMYNYANIIVRSSEQLLHIIDDIIIYSKLQTKLFTFFPSKFDLNQLLFEMQQSFDLPEYKKGIELKIEPPQSDPFFILSDPEKLKQVLTNLVSNAFKYTPTGTITVGYQCSDSETILYVSDTGPGIPPQEQQNVFERFYRGSNINKIQISGTGLGLSIVKELVVLLGGKIWVESEINKGSTFYISFPMSSTIKED